jgi:hypothetical protein
MFVITTLTGGGRIIKGERRKEAIDGRVWSLMEGLTKH